MAPQDAPGWRPGDGQRGEPGRGQEATKAIARRYFDFFRDVPRGIIGFETISGRGGEGQRVRFSLNPSAESGQPQDASDKDALLETISAFLTSWLFEIHFEFVAGPRPISESVIIDGAIMKISEEIMNFLTFWESFSENMCQNYCKGC